MGESIFVCARGLGLGLVLLITVSACTPDDREMSAVVAITSPQGSEPTVVAKTTPQVSEPTGSIEIQPPPPVPVTTPSGEDVASKTEPTSPASKARFGHYFATRYSDTPTDAVTLCEQPGVSGVVWRQTWHEVESSAGVYDFGAFDRVLAAIASSHTPQCHVWLFIEFKSFANSPVKNPCPAYLQARHSALNSNGNGAATCFIWEPAVVRAYVAMMQAAAARFDNDPRVEGVIFEESSLGLNGTYSQDVADGGTYTAEAWRDALVELVTQCGAAFRQSHCMAFMNFIRGGQAYLHDVSAALAALPDHRGCFSGPDVLPDSRSLYDTASSVYQVLVRHEGCRANSVQNDSYGVASCGLDCIFHFAVGGTFGDFDETNPRGSGLCVNSYLFWNHTVATSDTGLDWTDALPVIAAYPFGAAWTAQCSDSGGV